MARTQVRMIYMDIYLRPYFYRLEIDLAVLLDSEEMCQMSTRGSEPEASSGVSSREDSLSLGWERGVIERSPRCFPLRTQPPGV